MASDAEKIVIEAARRLSSACGAYVDNHAAASALADLRASLANLDEMQPEVEPLEVRVGRVNGMHVYADFQFIKNIVATFQNAACACIFACVLLVPMFANAKEVSGVVTDVKDGDTVVVETKPSMTKDGYELVRRYHVRLVGIDAPEAPKFTKDGRIYDEGQPYGDVAAEKMIDLALGKKCELYWHKLDRYGRVLGSVTVGKVDLSNAMVQAGAAWTYIVRTNHPIREVESNARKDRRGLWALLDTDHPPIAPSEWRKQKKAGVFILPRYVKPVEDSFDGPIGSPKYFAWLKEHQKFHPPKKPVEIEASGIRDRLKKRREERKKKAAEPAKDELPEGAIPITETRVDAQGLPVCGTEEPIRAFADALPKFNKSTVTWYLKEGPPKNLNIPMTRDEYRALIAEQFAKTSRIVKLSIIEETDPTKYAATDIRIELFVPTGPPSGGVGTVIGRATYPYTGTRFVQGFIQINNAWNWTKSSLGRCMLHEQGHALSGLGHGPQGQCVMSPNLANHLDWQQIFDRPEIFKRYEPREVTPTPIPTPSPPPPPTNLLQVYRQFREAYEVEREKIVTSPDFYKSKGGAEGWIRSLYRGEPSREPEQSGVDYWKSLLRP